MYVKYFDVNDIIVVHNLSIMDFRYEIRKDGLWLRRNHSFGRVY